jgi:hypothetical protein
MERHGLSEEKIRKNAVERFSSLEDAVSCIEEETEPQSKAMLERTLLRDHIPVIGVSDVTGVKLED